MPPAAAAGPKVSKACIIRSLQHEVDELRKQYEQIVAENVALRSREEVLLQQVTQQGDNLHFIALAASQLDAADMTDMAKTLMQDVEVHELLGLLGRSAGSTGEGDDEPFTTRCLRAAVTPERVAAMRSASIEEITAHLKQLTMRMFTLLSAGPQKAHLLSDSIEAVVDEYGEYGLLLHVVADRVSLQIGVLNLDTLEVQEPPPGYWEQVVDSLELQHHQIQTLATGFMSYQGKSKPIISALHRKVKCIRTILGGEDNFDSCNGNCSKQGRSFWEFLHNRLESPCSTGCNGACSSTAAQHCASAGEPEQAAEAAGAGDPACGVHRQGSQSSADTSSSLGVAPTQPWQQFGLSHGRLTAEAGEMLEQHMNGLMQGVMKLREMHRTVTWLFLNTLNPRQHALFITGSWPWWSRPLTMCQYIAEKYGPPECSASFDSSRSGDRSGSATMPWTAHPQQHAATSPPPAPSSMQCLPQHTAPAAGSAAMPAAAAAAAAAAVADSVLHMHLGMRPPTTMGPPAPVHRQLGRST